MANWSVRIRSTKVSEPVVPSARATTDEDTIRSMMMVRCPSVATYSYGGETLRWDSASPKSARLIRVYNASSPHCAYCLVIIDACIFERYPLNRDKREMGALSLS